jgi:hypothetical protein
VPDVDGPVRIRQRAGYQDLSFLVIHVAVVGLRGA